MTTASILEKLYNHAFDMVKFGETKNTVLIAFNGAIIVGISKLANDTHSCFVYYYSIFIIAMCAVSVFVSSAALIAKIKHTNLDVALPKNDNLLYFSTIAHLSHEDLIDKLKVQYGCTQDNANYEKDLARQAIITSQIASRKFKLFNVAIAFTFCGMLTPLSLVIYQVFLNHDK